MPDSLAANPAVKLLPKPPRQFVKNLVRDIAEFDVVVLGTVDQ
jgi:hypothetical protein